ncbi:uncharacterized protein LOC120331317 [Styela clava]
MEWFSKRLGRITNKSVTSNKGNDQGCSESEEQSGFEISDKNYNKWIRDKFVKKHGHIRVKNDSIKNHFWKIDRTSSQKEPIWTFASPSADGLLYVTYNMNESNNEVTMEYPMEKQSEKRILASSYSAQIKHGTESKKWLSSGPVNNYPVQQVQTSATQYWTITPSTGHIFQFSSGNCHITKELVFGDSSNAAKFKHTSSGSGVTIQCTDNSKYIHGPQDDGDLELNTTESEATVWEFPIIDAEFIVCGTTILLSEIPIEKSETA